MQQMLWPPRGAHLLQVRVKALNDDSHAACKRWYPARGNAPLSIYDRAGERSLRTATLTPVTGGPELAGFVSSARGHPHRALHWVPGRRNPSPSTIDRGSSSPEPATAGHPGLTGMFQRSLHCHCTPMFWNSPLRNWHDVGVRQPDRHGAQFAEPTFAARARRVRRAKGPARPAF